MPSLLQFEQAPIGIPGWVSDRLSFRRFLHSDAFPEIGRIWYLKGHVWVDLMKEQLYSHVQVKQEFSRVLGNICVAGKLGQFFPDGAYLSNSDGDFLSRPDGIFVSNEARDAEQVHDVDESGDGPLEIEGTPDMVLEVVSPSSVKKDTVDLREAYWQAGITEYWLVDARKGKCSFELLRHAPKGYVSVRHVGGWVKSQVFGKAFRFRCSCDSRANPTYELSVR
jgi:Uma2 family endonuclease